MTTFSSYLLASLRQAFQANQPWRGPCIGGARRGTPQIAWRSFQAIRFVEWGIRSGPGQADLIGSDSILRLIGFAELILWPDSAPWEPDTCSFRSQCCQLNTQGPLQPSAAPNFSHFLQRCSNSPHSSGRANCHREAMKFRSISWGVRPVSLIAPAAVKCHLKPIQPPRPP